MAARRTARRLRERRQKADGAQRAEKQRRTRGQGMTERAGERQQNAECRMQSAEMQTGDRKGAEEA